MIDWSGLQRQSKSIQLVPEQRQRDIPPLLRRDRRGWHESPLRDARRLCRHRGRVGGVTERERSCGLLLIRSSSTRCATCCCWLHRRSGALRERSPLSAGVSPCPAFLALTRARESGKSYSSRRPPPFESPLLACVYGANRLPCPYSPLLLWQGRRQTTIDEAGYTGASSSSCVGVA